MLQPRGARLSVIDEAAREAWFWCAGAADLPYWEYSAPFSAIIHWWLAASEVAFVHASAVGTEHGGVLIVGPSGSGKSTTALLSLEAGFTYAGDDHVAVEPDYTGQGPWVHSLYGTGKLIPGSSLTSPALEAAAINRSSLADEKAVILLNRYAPDRVSAGFPLRAVLVPRITHSPETRISPISPAKALVRLAPSSIFQLPGSAAADLRIMSRVVQAVPSFQIELGNDVSAIPSAISNLVERLSAA
jgi:hypothetical protein